jgi:hypothetical protein
MKAATAAAHTVIAIVRTSASCPFRPIVRLRALRSAAIAVSSARSSAEMPLMPKIPPEAAAMRSA